MSELSFYTIEKSDGRISFMLLFAAGRQHYVSSRIAFRNGLTDSGSLLAEQCVELLIKAIMRLHLEQKKSHDLVGLLNRGKDKFPYFRQILQDKKMVYFLRNLDEAYKSMRYGEAKFDIDAEIVIQLIDELTFNLSKTYLQVVKSTAKTQLYVPSKLEDEVLDKNKFFTRDKITNNPIASIGLPGVDFSKVPNVLDLPSTESRG